MTVLVCPSADDGCGNYRLKLPARAMQEMGLPVLVESDGNRVEVRWEQYAVMHPLPPNRVVEILSVPEGVDTIVYQRPHHFQWFNYVQLLREQGIRVVFDMDDLLHRIQPGNSAWFSAEPHWIGQKERQVYEVTTGKRLKVTRTALNERWLFTPEYEGWAHKGHLERSLTVADAIVYSTTGLRNYYSKKLRVDTVMENRLPARFLRHREWVDVPGNLIGWTGQVASHPEDPRVIRNVIGDLLATHPDWSFRTVGDKEGVEEEFGHMQRWSSTGYVEFSDYHDEYARFDIAVCPLADDIFNRSGKSWLKGLEAAFLGVVPVMSNMPEYRRLAELGIGRIAASKLQWERWVGQLMEHDMLREQFQAQGYAAAEKLTLEDQALDWFNAWKGTDA